MSFNREDENKKGFLPFLGRLFGSGAKGASTLGRAAGSAGIFSSKAGILGVILGGATIAAGVGVVYNFISPSSGKVYSPDLFQNAYYQEQAKKASIEREGVRNMASQSASSLDMFKEQAKKEGLAGEESAASAEGDNSSGDNSSQQPSSADNSAGVPEAAAGAADGGGKLNAALGFNNAKGGGGSSSMNKLQTSGGMFGSLGKQQFSPLRGSANLTAGGKAGAMKGALASNIKNSPKYTVPNIKRSGSFGQAKYAGKVGQKAAFSASDAGIRSAAEAAFTGETAGSGDVATPTGGTGIGGAGLSDSAKLKASDPNINSNEYTPPTPKEGEKDNPWQKTEDMVLYAMMAAAALILITKLLANQAKKAIGTPAFAGWMLAAKIAAYLALAAAAFVIYLAACFMSGSCALTGEKFDPQKYTGVMYMIAGAGLAYYAYQALSDLGDMETQNAAEIKSKVGVEGQDKSGITKIAEDANKKTTIMADEPSLKNNDTQVG